MMKGVINGNTPSTTITVKGVTAANSAITLPPNSIIDFITIESTNANAITGGLKFGTGSGLLDIVAAQAVAGNSLVVITDAAILKRYFSTTASQQIFFDAVTAWNSANVNVRIMYSKFS